MSEMLIGLIFSLSALFIFSSSLVLQSHSCGIGRTAFDTRLRLFRLSSQSFMILLYNEYELRSGGGKMLTYRESFAVKCLVFLPDTSVLFIYLDQITVLSQNQEHRKRDILSSYIEFEESKNPKKKNNKSNYPKTRKPENPKT